MVKVRGHLNASKPINGEISITNNEVINIKVSEKITFETKLTCVYVFLYSANIFYLKN